MINFTTYISRPDIIAPILKVTVHNASLLQPGYWLYAPHYESKVETLAGFINSSLQQGPYIFDTAGELAWSGAHIHDWTFVNDFKYHPWGEFSLLDGGTLRTSSPRGAEPMTLDSSLQSASNIRMPDVVGQVNPHELQLASDGETVVVEKAIVGSMSHDGLFQTVEDHVFEIDRRTGDVLFSWNSSEHIPTPKPRLLDLEGFAQTLEVHFLRVNSVDRTDIGDYLLSGRGTNTVYLISGTDGTILWRLGGKDAPSSDFELQNFTFSAQHDARMLHINESGVTMISFLDNASDGYETSGNASAGMVVALDHASKTASLVSRLERPDSGISDRRGNVQALPGGRFQVCWSQFGWVTEFDGEGRNIVEARFKDVNLYTYRAYKVLPDAFKGKTSAEVPAVAAFKVPNESNAHKGDAVVISTYVSWNGGFGVASWTIYGCSATPGSANADEVQPPLGCNGHWSLLIKAAKHGFETKLEHTTETDITWIYAEALDDANNLMAQSKPVAVRTINIGGGDAIGHQKVDSLETTTSSGISVIHSGALPTSTVPSAPLKIQSADGRIHGLNIVPWKPVSALEDLITRLLLFYFTVLASISIICAVRCLRNGRVQL